jgi:hypothetical protein
VKLAHRNPYNQLYVGCVIVPSFSVNILYAYPDSPVHTYKFQPPLLHHHNADWQSTPGVQNLTTLSAASCAEPHYGKCPILCRTSLRHVPHLVQNLTTIRAPSCAEPYYDTCPILCRTFTIRAPILCKTSLRYATCTILCRTSLRYVTQPVQNLTTLRYVPLPAVNCYPLCAHKQ